MCCCLIVEAKAAGRARRCRAAIQAASLLQEGFVVTQRRPSKQIDALPERPIVIVVDDDPEVREIVFLLSGGAPLADEPVSWTPDLGPLAKV